MILTEELLRYIHDVGNVCSEGDLAIQWMKDNDLFGKDLNLVLDLLQKEDRNNWYIWTNVWFHTDYPILFGPHEFIGKFKLTIVNDEPKFFDSLEEATIAKEIEIEKYKKNSVGLFSVNAHVIVEDVEITLPCDITNPAGPVADYFLAFDYTTGQYVNFDTYSEARDFAIEKQNQHNETNSKFFVIKRQVKELDGPITAWSVVG